MGIVIGLLAGLGLLLVWLAFAPAPPARLATERPSRMRDRLTQAGWASVSVGTFYAVCAVLAAFVAVVGLLLLGPHVLVVVAVVASALLPFVVVSSRARSRRRALRTLWPEVLDHLVSGIRAGLSLPVAVATLADTGPAALQAEFAYFRREYRAGGTLAESLTRLQARLADPVADRIVVALRLANEVGGTDLVALLRAMAQFLRREQQARGELEARQSWTVNGARLAVAAPWVTLLVLGTRPESLAAFNTGAGVLVIAVGAVLSVIGYRLMISLGRIPEEARVLR